MSASKSARPNGRARPSSKMPEHGERPAKRPRLAKNAHTVIEERKAHDDTALEVDIMILDYLAYQSTTACFASRISTPNNIPVSLGQNLPMTNTFIAVFNAHHPTHTSDPEMRFRLHLLQLTTFFTQRLTRNPSTPPRASLQKPRASNRDRARNWIGSADRIPSASYDTAPFDDPSSFPGVEELERNRAHVLHELNIPAEDEAYEDAFYGTSSCVSLLDLLPLFMKVSATRNSMSGSSLTSQWMRMAGEFMLQAALEHYLVVGAQGSDAVDEAFAWGYKEVQKKYEQVGIDEWKEVGKKIDNVNDMFEDPLYETEVDGWQQVKEHNLALLFPPSTVKSSRDTYSVPSSDDAGMDDAGVDQQPATDLVSHLEIAAAKHPIATFEETVLSFLDALSQSVAKPVLTQLEAGELDGMSKEETADFVRSCGLSTARFYEAPVGFKTSVAE